MKKPTPGAQDAAATLPEGAANTWANQASTRLGGSRVVDESHLTAPVAAAPDAAPSPNPTSEET